jgi:hypothetical protein
MSRYFPSREFVDAQSGPARHRSGPSRLGHHLRPHHRVPPTRPSAAGRRPPRTPGGPAVDHPDPAAPSWGVVVALGRPRRAQHRALLRPALRQRLPAARGHGGRPGRRAALGRGRPDRPAPDRADRPTHRARRHGGCHRRGPGRAHRDRPARPTRVARGPGRHLVHGARAGAHQALGPPRCPAPDLDRLAADGGRSASRPGRAGRRGSTSGADLDQPRGLRLLVDRGHGDGVLNLVLGVGAAAGRPDLAARAALAGGRHRGRLGGAGPGSHADPGGRDGARVRRGGVGSARLSADPRSRRCGSESRCGPRATSPGRAGRCW